jgi:LysM repeat protein
MALFSISTYENVVNACVNDVQFIENQVNAVIGAEEELTGWLPLVGGAIKDLLNDIKTLVEDIATQVKKLIEQAQAPVLFWHFAEAWGAGGIASQAGQISGNINSLNQFSSAQWQGLAGDAFASAVSQQEPAVAAVQSHANSVSGSCHAIAQMGFGMYTAVATTLVGLAAGICITAPALPALIGACVAAGLAIAGAIAALEYGLSTQTASLNQQLEPYATFPNGKWPEAVASTQSTTTPQVSPGTGGTGTSSTGTSGGNGSTGTGGTGTVAPIGTGTTGTSTAGTGTTGTSTAGTGTTGAGTGHSGAGGHTGTSLASAGTGAAYSGGGGAHLQPVQHVGGGTYTIQPGDNLFDLAQEKYGDGNLWPVIWGANSRVDPDPNLIYPGQVLHIPSIPKPPAGSTAILVQPGQTLSQIANGNPQQLAAIEQANNLTSSSTLDPGQALIIPPA